MWNVFLKGNKNRGKNVFSLSIVNDQINPGSMISGKVTVNLETFSGPIEKPTYELVVRPISLSKSQHQYVEFVLETGNLGSSFQRLGSSTIQSHFEVQVPKDCPVTQASLIEGHSEVVLRLSLPNGSRKVQEEYQLKVFPTGDQLKLLENFEDRGFRLVRHGIFISEKIAGKGTHQYFGFSNSDQRSDSPNLICLLTFVDGVTFVRTQLRLGDQTKSEGSGNLARWSNPIEIKNVILSPEKMFESVVSAMREFQFAAPPESEFRF